MTLYHKHHIVPKHMGGTDEPSNLKKVTIKQHSIEHKKLYEKYGRWQDKIAYQTLSGQISVAEATKMAQIKANSGPKTGKRLEAVINNFKKASEMNKGKKRPEKTKKLISKANKKYWGNIPNRPWQMKSYVIDGKEYKGLEEIMKTFNIKSYPALYYRFKSNSKKFSGWTNTGSFKNK